MDKVPPEFIDITAPQIVEVQIRDDGSVLWVNVDGICALRISRIPEGMLILDGVRRHALAKIGRRAR